MNKQLKPRQRNIWKHFLHGNGFSGPRAMFLKRLFGAKRPKPASVAGSADDDAGRLRTEIQLCLARSGGAMATGRRVDGLVAWHRRHSPAARKTLGAVLSRLNDDAAEVAAAHYSKIEESEFYGRRSSRLAFFDAFETPRRRMLALIRDADGGRELLENLRAEAGADLAADIGDILSGP